ncbi:MAG: hypothetical protein MJZ40_02540 [Bacteroidaceae bacterium]|nr:hypothetical protein [Bacteroidaceae bacterium]
MKNVEQQQYLGIEGNLSVVESSDKLLCTFSAQSDGTFNVGISDNYLHIGTGNRWSKGTATKVTIFKVNAEGTSASKVTTLEAGSTYVMVSSPNYAISGTNFGTGNSRRLNSETITVESTVATSLTDNVKWVLEPSDVTDDRTDIEGINLRSASGDYLAFTSDHKISVSRAPYTYNIRKVNLEDSAWKVWSEDEYQFNSGSNGFFSPAPKNNNGSLNFYFYEASISGNTLTATRVAQPEVGKQYLFVVDKGGSYYAAYAEIATRKNTTGERLDVVAVGTGSLPENITINAGESTSDGGTINLSKCVWGILNSTSLNTANVTLTGSETILTQEQLRATANGAHFAMSPVSTNSITSLKFYNGEGSMGTELTYDYLCTLVSSGTDDVYYLRTGENSYFKASAFGKTSDEGDRQGFVVGQGSSNDGTNNYSDQSTNWIRFTRNGQSTWLNSQTGGGTYNTGAGGWTAFATFGPYYVATIVCQDETDNVITTEKRVVKANTYVEIPVIDGYTYLSGNEGFVNDADKTFTFKYRDAGVNVTFVYTDPAGGSLSQDVTCTEGEAVSIEDVPTYPYFTATGFEESDLVATEEHHEFHVIGTWEFPFKFSTISDGAFDDNTTWYTIQNNGNATNNTGNGHVNYTGNASAENAIGATRELKTANLYCFVAIPNTPGYFTLYNMAAGADKPMREKTNPSYVDQHHNQSLMTFNQADDEVKLAVRANNDGLQFYLPDYDEPNYRAVVGKHVGSNLSVWGKNNEAPLTDNGSRFFVKEIDDLVEAVVDQQDNFVPSMIVGESLSLASNIDAAITNYKAEQTPATLKALAEANANPEETPLREFDTNKYYRLIDLANRYVYAVPVADSEGTPTSALDLKIYAAGTVATDAASLFRIHKDGDNCTIEHVNSSYYIGVPPHGNATHLAATGAEFTIENNGATKFLFKNGSEYLNTNSSLTRVDGWTSNGDGSQWKLEEVAAISVEFKAAGNGYATLYAPVAVEVPEGVVAYTAARIDNYLTANEVTEVPAKIGVVLKKTVASSSDEKIMFRLATTEPEAESVLTGTCIDRATTDGNYVFSIVSENPGFYKFGGENLAANKAYYHPTSADVQGFVIDFGGITTGINAAQQAQGLKASFDLQGRRVSKAVRGLFIHNGVKVIK